MIRIVSSLVTARDACNVGDHLAVVGHIEDKSRGDVVVQDLVLRATDE